MSKRSVAFWTSSTRRTMATTPPVIASQAEHLADSLQG
jgi:hypothetical protein